MSRRARRRKDDPQIQAPPAPDRSIVADRDISGIASTGDYATNVQYRLPAEAFTPMAELAVPPGLANLPAHAGLFVGRTEALARLDAALAAPGGAVVQAVHGLGGIGKSTLAAYWAANHTADHVLTWWITADTLTAIDTGLAALAVAMQPALSGALQLEALREQAVQWLAAHGGWLLILDNVIDPADVAPLLGRATSGRFLITSRRATGWHRIAVPVRLDVLGQAEAVDLLSRIVTHDGPDNLDGADELCAELGFLPLAIEQAAAYLAETGATPREYLRLLADYPATMYRSSAEGSDAAHTIARIWRVTLDRLAEEPLTGQVLRILAWYAPADIPRTLLDGLAEPPELLRAIGRLAAYSMLTAEVKTLTVHRLVQAVARTPDPDDPHRDPQAIADARDKATGQLASAMPEDLWSLAAWPTWRSLLPHIDALASHASPETDTEATAYLLNQTGDFLTRRGDIARAVGYLQRALADRQRVLGADHPDTLASRNNLATAYRAAGDLRQAIPLHEQTLADRRRVLGADHRDTLASRNNLASAYQDDGDLRRAIPLHEQTLADRRRVLGADHPDTLASRYNLATAYQESGELRRAIPLHEQTLADSVRVLGYDHPDTLASRNNLAIAYQDDGDLRRAIHLFEHILADRLRVLGADHPDTLTARYNLATAYQESGDLRRAIPLHEQGLTDSMRVLGADHPDTLRARNNLAKAYMATGDLGRVIPLQEQILADYVRIKGVDHPETLRARNNLASAHNDAGNPILAIPIFEQTLADSVRVFGADHPNTKIVRDNLDNARGQLGRQEEAVAAYHALRVDPAQPGEGEVDILLAHEQQYWRKAAEARNLDYQPEILRKAVAAACLTGATQQREALATLTLVPELRDQAEDRLLSVASLLHDLYPPPEDQYWGSLQPDVLAEHFVGQIALLDPDFIVQLLAGATDAQKYRAFHILDRAADHQPHLVDVWSPVERIIHAHGDSPSGDAAVRQELLRPGSTLLTLGKPLTGPAAGTAHLLHCTVPVGEESIAMLPVFTRMEHVASAVVVNPTWQSLQVLQMDAQVVLGELEEGEWLGINPWSGREFKIPAASVSSGIGRDEEEAAAAHSEARRVDPGNTAAHPGLGNALADLRRFAATFTNTGDSEASTGPT